MASPKCAFHPQRPAFANCMTCRKVLCQECATQWDGIWHCHACLTAKRGEGVQRMPVMGWILVIAASFLILFCSAHVMVWTGALLAGLS